MKQERRGVIQAHHQKLPVTVLDEVTQRFKALALERISARNADALRFL